MMNLTRRDARHSTVEAVTFPYSLGKFMSYGVMGYECRLVDERTGLDLRAWGDTSDGATMRALGSLTGCWWQYAARQ